MKNGILHASYGILLALSIGLNIYAFIWSEADAPPAKIADRQLSPKEYRTLEVSEERPPGRVASEEPDQNEAPEAEIARLRNQIASIQNRNQKRATEAYLKTAEGTTPDLDILLGGGSHGIVPQQVTIARRPDSAKTLAAFLPGTVWSWASIDGARAADLGEYVIFLEDGTMFGSWGLRYSYSVSEDLTIEWWKHRLTFGEDFQGFRVDGQRKRIGRLLQKVEGAELKAAVAALSHTYVVHADDEDGQPETLPDKLR